MNLLMKMGLSEIGIYETDADWGIVNRLTAPCKQQISKCGILLWQVRILAVTDLSK